MTSAPKRDRLTSLRSKRTIRRGDTKTATALPLFSLKKEGCDERITAYCERDAVKAIRFENKAYRVQNDVRCRGIHKALKARFYPGFTKPAKRRVRNGTKAIASSKKIGKQVDQQLENFVRSGRMPRRPHRFTAAILTFFEARGEVLHACQLPVHLEGTRVATQGDHFTVSRTERDLATGLPMLTMWELKTGFTTGATAAQGRLAEPLHGVASTQFNHFQLQRKATHDGFVRAGLPLNRSRVLHVSAVRDARTRRVTVNVDEMNNADWLRGVDLLRELE